MAEPRRRYATALLAGLAALWSGPLHSAESPPPFTVADGLFDTSRPDTLGLDPLPGSETCTVFRGSEAGGAYNHGTVLVPFRGKLYAQWQNSARDEDSPDTRVLYTSSDDGCSWSAPVPLLPDGYGPHSAGGWWTDDETLVAWIVRWGDPELGARDAVTEYATSTDGRNWSAPGPVRDHTGNPVTGVIEQDPHQLPGGRIVTAFHENPGLLLAPWYTDDPLGLGGWTRGRMKRLPYEGNSSREIEPSWFLRGDGAVVMVMRDQASSHQKLASLSFDKGETWSVPVLTGMPDSRSKQSAGNLPNGTAYLVGNPTTSKQRYPLALILARDGMLFDRAFLLRAGGEDLPPRRYDGRYKRAGFSYPKSVLWRDWLYVGYATNKEDIELTRVLLDSLEGEVN